MKRALAEEIGVGEAADYFTYRSYADKGDSEKGNYGTDTRKDSDGQKYKEDEDAAGSAQTPYPHAPDFFRGMDGISVAVDENGRPLDKPPTTPDQMLDSKGDRQPTKVVDPTLGGKAGDHSEIIGRNTWIAWCGGNEGFWDYLATDSLGFVDFVKLVDSRNRSTRFAEAGMINEPGMRQSTVSSKYEFGLFLDHPDDHAYRAWRSAYLQQTFEQIAAGKHKSQLGLNKRDAYGEHKGKPLFNGDSTEHKGEGYLYPSQYLPENEREELYASVVSKRDRESGNKSGKRTGQKHDEDDTDDTLATKGSYNASPEYSKYDNALDNSIPPPDLYGLSSGIVGLRLFPNPYFDAEAQKKWDADRYYDPDDKKYWTDPKLVRPFRVGMSCAFCHASFHPLQPPHDVNNPEWTNLSGNIGAQYLSMRATVGNLLKPDNFVYHLLESQPRGTIDTSLVASDNVNNPNTMNAVFGLPERAILSLNNPKERLAEAGAGLPSLWDDLNPDTSGLLGDSVIDPVPEHWANVAKELGVMDRIEQSNSNPRYVPRILLDGSDGIGTWGALARVYLNIGTYWEQWNELHQVVIGFEPQRPFTIADCETNSVYWNATERRVPGLRDYFLRVTPPMPLLSTPDGKERLAKIDKDQLRSEAKDTNTNFNTLYEKKRSLSVDRDQLAAGRKVFAKNCIVCHSSIQPESSASALISYNSNDSTESSSSISRTERFRVTSARAKYRNRFQSLIDARNAYRIADEESGELWEHDPARWLNDETYIAWALDSVERPEFWKNNFLSTDYRIPVNVVGTNAARAMATNAMSGHMWEDFASASYRELPSPGEIAYFNPYKGEAGEMDSFTPRHVTPEGAPEQGGGPGYYRVPSLISIWATAPFLHNNSLGLYNNDPSVDGRLEAFDDAIRKMLWPARRLESSSYNQATPERLMRDHGLIWRTTQETFLNVDSKRVPTVARTALGLGQMNRVPGLRWLKIVSPVWLPSAVLLAGALLTLLLSNSHLRRTIASTIVAVGLLFAFARWVAISYPLLSILDFARTSDLWLPITALGIVGFVLWLPIWGESKLRWAGSCILVVALGLGILGLFAHTYPKFSFGDVLRGVTPWWMPLVVLATVAAVLWLPLSSKWTRYSGYGATALALVVGAIVMFNAGELGDISIGPIPAGTPVNLLANFNSEADRDTQIKTLHEVSSGLAEISSRNLAGDKAQSVIREKVARPLMEVNKCPDFVMDRGHYFPWFDSMTDDDKNALIELLKTF